MIIIEPKYISKELFKIVMGIDPFADIELTETNKGIEYIIKNYESEEDDELVYIDFKSYINIYELAHKCKEWAYTKNYHLNCKKEGDFWFCYCENLITDGYDYVSKYKYSGPEAIFEAAEWVLKHTKE